MRQGFASLAGLFGAMSLGVVSVGCADTSPDEELRSLLAAQEVESVDPGPLASPAMVRLGEALFFDRELSGNRNIACADCHHPSAATGDALAVSIGTGGIGLGTSRELGSGDFIPRNAPEIFNRGSRLWTTMFWDNRVATAGYVDSPAGSQLPPGLEHPLEVQAMFPVTSRDEMRGRDGDIDVFGGANELAVGDDLPAIWEALAARLVGIERYRVLFADAYPALSIDDIGFQHAAKAIAAYEIDAFTFLSSPFDRYLAGDDEALDAQEKRGAILFYGKAQCSSCHAGPLLSDQKAHNICAPQIGPGKGDEAPEDWGRGRESGDPAERYAFRTPPLRNVALTGPYMHDGSYTELEAAVQHHLDPRAAMTNYDRQQLDPRLHDLVIDDPVLLEAMTAAPDPLIAEPLRLSDAEFDDLMAFLHALTDPAAVDLSHLVPQTVPSGLPVTH